MIDWAAEDRAKLNWLKASKAGLEMEKLNAWGEREKEIDAQLKRLEEQHPGLFQNK